MSEASLYILLAGGSQLADTISRGVCDLSWPNGVKPTDTTTTHAFAWMEHPDRDITAVVLIVPRSLTVPLHLLADTAPLVQLLKSLKDDQGQPLLSQAEEAQLVQLIDHFSGATVPAEWIVPTKALVEAKSWSELVDEGWVQAN